MYRLSVAVLAILSTSSALRTEDTPGGIAAAAVAEHNDPAVTYFDDRAAFTVTGVDQGTGYRGRNSGLTEGMTLVIRRSSHYFTPSGGEYRRSLMVRILGVSSVSSASTMRQIRACNREIHRGDTAWLPFVEPKNAKKPPLSSWRESPSSANKLETDRQTSSHPILPLAAESANVRSARVFAQAGSSRSRRGEAQLSAAGFEQIVLSNQSGRA